jgi:transitional endoplasmic reticulum ATPase
VTETPDTDFEKVIGLEEAKRELDLRVMGPLLHPKLAAEYKVRAGGAGVLLYGPPGCGKTLLARALCCELTKRGLRAAFFSVAVAQMGSKWYGEAEQLVGELFAKARSQPTDVTIIFMDEADALLSRSSSSSVQPRVRAQFLVELDGLRGGSQSSATPVLLVAGTNRPEKLDRAVVRPGRIDAHVYVGPPDEDARVRILELELRGRPVAPDVDLQGVARLTGGYSGADLASLVLRAAQLPFEQAIGGAPPRSIDQADLEEALRRTPPSITPEELTRYLKYAAAHE